MAQNHAGYRERFAPASLPPSSQADATQMSSNLFLPDMSDATTQRTASGSSFAPQHFSEYFAKKGPGSERGSTAKSQHSSQSGGLRENSYDSTITAFDAERLAADIVEGGVEGTLTWSAPLWDQLAQAHYACPPKNEHRSAICQKLILNHQAVLRDICNARPVSQLQLVRVPPQNAEFADGVLREVARRLLGKGGKHLPMVELVEGAPLEQVQAWSLVATYLSSRIQSTPEERPGRKPDMTPESADILRAALQEVWWQAYQALRRRGPA